MGDGARTVVVTGASAGIGRATAVEFGRHGWNVGLIARGREGLEAARDEVERAGGRGLVLQADVSDANALDAAADQADRAFGGIHVWVNNAMVTVYAPVLDMTAEEFRRVTEVTYLGYVHGTMSALKRMRPRNRGTIVQIGSALAYRSIPLQSAYCAAKHAIRGFTDSLRSELIHDGSDIRLTMVQLPAVNTPQFEWARNRLDHRPQPVPPIYQPEAIAHAIFRAAMETPREMWVGKSSMQAIVGNMVAPGRLDSMMADQAYSGQQTDEPAREHPDNLFDPVPRYARTHGRFDDQAKGDVLDVSSEVVRLSILGTMAGLGLAAAAAGALGRRLLLPRRR